MRIGLTLAVALAVAWPALGDAQEVVPFYKGKQIRFVISAGVSGAYSEYARTLSRHMGRHLDGNPDFIVESMPGAGGLIATNWLYHQAPKDGATIGLIHSTVPLAPLFGTKGARFDAAKFNWLGSIDQSNGMCTAWHTSPVKTWDDMLNKEFIVGGAGAGSQMDIYPAVINKLFGTKIKVVTGYRDGGAIFLAMERGEIHGRCSPQLTSIKSVRPQWLAENKIVIPVVIDEKREPMFPDSPAIMEFAKTDAVRQQLELLMVNQHMDRPLLLPPDVPAERVNQMRRAFDATMKDPAFVAEAEKQRLHLDPLSGEELARVVQNAYALPKEVIESAKETMGGLGAE